MSVLTLVTLYIEVHLIVKSLNTIVIMVILKQMSCLFRLGGLQLSTNGFAQLHEHLSLSLLDVVRGAADERQHEIQQ